MDSVTVLLNGEVHPCVEVVEGCGEWHVRVVDGDDREKTLNFELESIAPAYAEGQRMRLGLDHFVRL
ncbi:hypothetical protein AB4Z43_29440 [Mesorhizobium sp. 2RAF45]|uniref:hypothetical protein n=1 Tax=Mesorhizobium sp. 2RAF45 TaxID=3233001 RepID=UPI003F950C00